MPELDLLDRTLCDVQGKVFESALKKGYDCPAFIESFMNSRVATGLDDTYDRLQWAGEEYILAEFEEETGSLPLAGVAYSNEVMYWAGYTYRYWHYYTRENSKRIYEKADAEMMNSSWLAFHTMDVRMAIDDLNEIYEQRIRMNNRERGDDWCRE